MSKDLQTIESPHTLQLKGGGAFQALYDLNGFDAALEKSEFGQEALMKEILTLISSRDLKVKAQGLALLMRTHSYATKLRHNPITVTSERRITTPEGTETQSITQRISVRGALNGIPEACTIFKPLEVRSRAPRTDDYDPSDPTAPYFPEEGALPPGGTDVLTAERTAAGTTDLHDQGDPVPNLPSEPERAHDAGLP